MHAIKISQSETGWLPAKDFTDKALIESKTGAIFLVSQRGWGDGVYLLCLFPAVQVTGRFVAASNADLYRQFEGELKVSN